MECVMAMLFCAITRKLAALTYPILLSSPRYWTLFLEKIKPNSHATLSYVTETLQVYYQGSKAPVFFVANRGHHADIGGLVPGSMPPHSTCLDQEGAAFVSFKLVEGGHFNEAALVEQLNAPGKVPGMIIVSIIVLIRSVTKCSLN